MRKRYVQCGCGVFQSYVKPPRRAQCKRQYVWAVAEEVFIIRVPSKLRSVEEEVDVDRVVVVVVFVVNV